MKRYKRLNTRIYALNFALKLRYFLGKLIFSFSLSLWSLDIAAQINSITPRYAFHSNMEMHVKHNVAHAMIKIEMNFVIWFGSNDDKQLPIKKKNCVESSRKNASNKRKYSRPVVGRRLICLQTVNFMRNTLFGLENNI